MKTPYIRDIPLAVPTFDKEMEEAAINALRNERSVLGEDVFKFEEEFANYVGTKFAVSTSSGTNALHIALLALGISNSDEVITSAFSFVASSNAIIHARAKPVFVDVEFETGNINAKRIKPVITEHTKSLLPVHLYGYPCQMQEIKEIADSHNLKIVEDACQAHGAGFTGVKTGAIGDAGCFSFYPSKNMTVFGDGGMIVTNDQDVARMAAKLRDCGRKSQYEHDVIGYTSRLDTIKAAIGRVQLKKLDEWNTKRLENASIYDKLLSSINDVVIPPKGNLKVKPVYHLYVIKAERRDELKSWLQSNGIQSGVHYPLPIPLQPIYKQLFKFRAGEYPVSEEISKKCLSLPVHPKLSQSDIEYVCEKISEFYHA